MDQILIKNLKNVPGDTETGRLIKNGPNISVSSIKHTLMKLISPHTTDHFDENDVLTMHFKRLHSTHADYEPSNHLRSYISNTACAYINRCFEKRKKYLEEASAKIINAIDINIIRAP